VHLNQGGNEISEEKSGCLLTVHLEATCDDVSGM
jgi:hypothetical protein